MLPGHDEAKGWRANMAYTPPELKTISASLGAR